MYPPDPSPDPDFERRMREIQAEAERKERERLRRDADNRRRGTELINQHVALSGALLIASVLVPALIMMAMGSELDRALLGLSATVTMLTMAGPIAVSIAMVKNVIIEWLMQDAFDRSLAGIYGNHRTPMPKAKRLGAAMHVLKAASIVLPVAGFWSCGGALDRAVGHPGPLVAIGGILACWLAVKYLVLGRWLIPLHGRLVHEAVYGSSPDAAVPA